MGLGADLGATDHYLGKVLFVKAGESLSLQFHRHKDESWYVESGRAKLELGDAGEAVLNEEVVTAPAFFHFAPGTVHRVTALDDTTIIEVSTLVSRRRRPARGQLRPRGDERYLDTTCVKVRRVEGMTRRRSGGAHGLVARMLRYLERSALVVPRRSAPGTGSTGCAS